MINYLKFLITKYKENHYFIKNSNWKIKIHFFLETLCVYNFVLLRNGKRTKIDAFLMRYVWSKLEFKFRKYRK